LASILQSIQIKEKGFVNLRVNEIFGVNEVIWLVFMKKLLFVVFFGLLFSLAFAADNNFVWSDDLKEAKLATNNIAQQIISLRENGFKTTRITDEFSLIKQVYENNYLREKNGFLADYSLIKTKVAALNTLIALIYTTHDELAALDAAIVQASKELDVSAAKEIYLSAKQEYDDERYEFVSPKIDLTYEKINELQSLEAKTAAAYEATRKNVSAFFEDNWHYIALIVIVPSVIYLIFRKKIKRTRKLARLEANRAEINVLKKEMMASQEKYFVQQKLPESEYHIKIRLYAEKIRNLNGENALLEKELLELKVPESKIYKQKKDKE